MRCLLKTNDSFQISKTTISAYLLQYQTSFFSKKCSIVHSPKDTIPDLKRSYNSAVLTVQQIYDRKSTLEVFTTRTWQFFMKEI